MIWPSFLATFRKEYLHILRNRATLLIALSYPIFQLLLFGFIDQSVRDLPTVVVDQDHSRHSRELVDQLRATGTFEIIQVATDPQIARAQIISGRAKVAVVIPPDFRDARSRHDPISVEALVDGSDATVSTQAVAALNGIASDVSLRELTQQNPRAGMPLSVRPVILFNPEGRTTSYLVPGMVAMLIQIIGVMLTAMSIVRERERGTLDQLLVSPIAPLGLMLGKLAPYLVLGLAEVSVILAIMRFAFDVPIRGSLVFLFAMMIVYLFVLQALGLLISVRAVSQAAAIQQAQILQLPSVFLSGYIFPTAALPRPLYYIGRLLPATHMVEIMRGVVLRNAGLFELLPNVLTLVVFAIVLLGLAVKRFSKVMA